MVDYLSSNRNVMFKSIYDQVLRSGTSIMANVRESQFAQNKAGFISKLQIALKEANETIGWLILLTDKKCITEREGTSMKMIVMNSLQCLLLLLIRPKRINR